MERMVESADFRFQFISSLLRTHGLRSELINFLMQLLELGFDPQLFMQCCIIAKDIFDRWFRDPKEHLLIVTLFNDRIINVTLSDKEGQVLENLLYDTKKFCMIESVPLPFKVLQFNVSLLYEFFVSQNTE
ncbi:MAG: hypothetical protein QW808_00755 [Desulfurococcaceae archaeon]